MTIKRGVHSYVVPGFSALNITGFKDAIIVGPSAGSAPSPVYWCAGPPVLSSAPALNDRAIVVSGLKNGTVHPNMELKTHHLIGATVFPGALDGSVVSFSPPYGSPPGASMMGEVFRQVVGSPHVTPGSPEPVVTVKTRRQFANVPAMAETPVMAAMTRLGKRPHMWGSGGLITGAAAAEEAGKIGSGFLARLGLFADGANSMRGPLVSAAPSLAAIAGVVGAAADTRLSTLAAVFAAAGTLGSSLDLVAQVASIISPSDGSPEPTLTSILQPTSGDPFTTAASAQEDLDRFFASIEHSVSLCVRDRRVLEAERAEDPPPGLHMASDADQLVTANIATRVVDQSLIDALSPTGPAAAAPAPPSSGGARTFARCARAGCPCPASWNGIDGQYCSFTCRDGTPCASAVHTVPTDAAWLNACRPCGPPVGTAAASSAAAAPAAPPAAAAAATAAPTAAAPVGGGGGVVPPAAPPMAAIDRARTDGLMLVSAGVPDDAAALDAAILRLVEMAGWANFHGLVGRGANPRPPDDTIASHMCWYSAAAVVAAVDRAVSDMVWVRPNDDAAAVAQIAHLLTMDLTPPPDTEEREDVRQPEGTVKVAGAKTSELALAPPQSAFNTLSTVNFAAAAETTVATSARGGPDALWMQAGEACKEVEGAPEALARVVASNGKPRATGSGADSRVTVVAWPLSVRDEVLVEAARLMAVQLPDRAIGFGEGGSANPSAARAAAMATAEKLLAGQFLCKDVVPFLGQSICASSTDVALGSIKSKDSISKAFKRLADPLDLILEHVMGCPPRASHFAVRAGGAIYNFVEWMLANITGDAAVLVHLVDSHVLYTISKAVMDWRGMPGAPPPDIGLILNELRMEVREAGHEARLKFASPPSTKTPRAAAKSPASSSTHVRDNKRQKKASPATPKGAIRPAAAAAAPALPRKPSAFKERWNAYDRAIGASALAEADKPCFMFFCGHGCAAPCQKGRRHLITADQKRAVIAAKLADGSNVASPENVNQMHQFTG